MCCTDRCGLSGMHNRANTLFRLQNHHGLDRVAPPTRYDSTPGHEDEVPRMLPSLSTLVFDDRMDLDTPTTRSSRSSSSSIISSSSKRRRSGSGRSSSDAKRGKPHDVEVATTLASMASFNLQSPILDPSSPTRSFVSIKSDGMTRSTNSQFSSPEPRSPDLPSVDARLSLSNKTRGFTAPIITLPRLRDLDLRPLEPDFIPNASFLSPSSASPMSGAGALRRASLDSTGNSSFCEPRFDLVPSQTAYPVSIPPMPYPDAALPSCSSSSTTTPSPSIGGGSASQHQRQLPYTHTHAHSSSHALSSPRRLPQQQQQQQQQQQLQHVRLPMAALQTSNGASSPSRRARRSPTGSRCNVKYTIQQVDFIDYFRVDHHLSWKEVEAKYAAVFPEDAAKGHKRGPQGLQGVYYRKNKQIPVTDAGNLLVFDDDDNPRTFQCDVREQGKKLNSSIGLLGMHPERAITYPWVSEEHKMQYDKLGRARQAQLDAAEARKKRRRALQTSRL